MNQGRVRQCAVRPVATRQCRLGCGGFLNHARAGTGLDRRQRRGMDYGAFGHVRLSSAQFGQGPVSYANHHAVGAVPASTPDGGIGLVTARLGKARRVEARHGESTIVVGTAAASTPRGGVESRLTEIAQLMLKGAKDGTNAR